MGPPAIDAGSKIDIIAANLRVRQHRARCLLFWRALVARLSRRVRTRCRSNATLMKPTPQF